MKFYKDNLREIRRSKGLSQKDLADRSRKEEFSFSKPSVSAWELGTQIPRAKHVITLAKILGIKTTDISDFELNTYQREEFPYNKSISDIYFQYYKDSKEKDFTKAFEKDAYNLRFETGQKFLNIAWSELNSTAKQKVILDLLDRVIDKAKEFSGSEDI